MINKSRRRRNTSRPLEDLQDPPTSVHRSDGIDRLNLRHGCVELTQDFQQNAVQHGSEEGRIARSDDDSVPSCGFETAGNPLNRSDAFASVDCETGLRSNQSNPIRHPRIRDRHDDLVPQRGDRIDDPTDHRVAAYVDESLRPTESSGLATRKDQRRVHDGAIGARKEKARLPERRSVSELSANQGNISGRRISEPCLRNRGGLASVA